MASYAESVVRKYSPPYRRLFTAGLASPGGRPAANVHAASAGFALVDAPMLANIASEIALEHGDPLPPPEKWVPMHRCGNPICGTDMASLEEALRSQDAGALEAVLAQLMSAGKANHARPKKSLQACGRCRTVKYCSAECQKAVWTSKPEPYESENGVRVTEGPLMRFARKDPNPTISHKWECKLSAEVLRLRGKE
ncbi:hypothetical protein DFJ74DRAFT_704095 [Hyaloraphidium curvatum]|nr:hypothetical protein DFJ74DRAFT_704095 [Hyaloraphidium curvatum]